jgi:hypothetical protein
MKNIILEKTPADVLATVFAAHPPTTLLPPLGDRAWAAAAANPNLQGFITAMRKTALSEVDTSLPVLSDELYSDYFKTGQRLPF